MHERDVCKTYVYERGAHPEFKEKEWELEKVKIRAHYRKPACCFCMFMTHPHQWGLLLSVKNTHPFFQNFLWR